MTDWTQANVECYAGYRADERPVSFTVEGRTWMVVEMLRTWREPDLRYFRIRASDGSTYLLEHNDRTDLWRVSLSS